MCKQCGTNFVIDTSEWNPKAIQHREEQKRIEKKKKQDAELETLRIKVSGEEKAAAWKESRQMKSELNDLKASIDTLPGLLRGVVKRHIKKQQHLNNKTS